MMKDMNRGERYSWYCTDCGQGSTNTATPFYEHQCQHDVLVAHQVEQFECQFLTFMASVHGKFARYLATNGR
jgi:hypothetical protein